MKEIDMLKLEGKALIKVCSTCECPEGASVSMAGVSFDYFRDEDYNYYLVKGGNGWASYYSLSTEDIVEIWHKIKPKAELHEYLGMSWGEYDEYVRYDTIPQRMIKELNNG